MTTTSDNLGSLALDLDELKSMLADASPARVVIAANWAKPAAPFALLEAFSSMVAPEDPVELVFSVPLEPTEEDARCVQVLLEEVGVETEIGAIQIESFTETARQPHDISVVPLGDDMILTLELTRTITRLHQIITGRVEPEERNLGDQSALARRLATFAEQM